MDEPLRLEYACTPEELQHAQELQLGRALRPNRKLLSLLALVLGGVLLFAFVTVGPKKNIVAPQKDIGMLQPIVILLCITVLTMVALWLRKLQKKPHDEDATSLLEITPSEVRLAGDAGWAMLSWSAFGKVLESETLFVLPLANGSSLLVFPKRIFADERACNSFREMAQQAGQPVGVVPAEISPPKATPETQPGALRIEVNLQFIDYVDRNLASWKTLVLMIVVAAVVLGLFVWASFHRAPNAPFSIAETFLYFCLPVLVVLELGIFLLLTLGRWKAHRQFISTQSIELSDTGLACTQRDSRAAGEWNARLRYKETPQSFISGGLTPTTGFKSPNARLQPRTASTAVGKSWPGTCNDRVGFSGEVSRLRRRFFPCANRVTC